MIREMPDAEQIAWLRLARTQGVGSKTFFKLIARYGTAKKALEKLPNHKAAGGKPYQPLSETAARKEWSDAEALGATLICAYEESYPALLKAIDDPPPVLTVRGNLHLLMAESVAMVGARNASANGRQLAVMLAEGMGKAGLTVVSGLARGIDGAAHTGALHTGTIAVLAGGVDHIYPKEHKKLYEEILRHGGAIVSEHPCGMVPKAEHFPRRNRIIAGLSKGTLVVEASKRSGSLITARLAAEQGREVMATPGFPLDPRAEGPNHLLKEGATLVTSAEDVVEAVERPVWRATPILKAQEEALPLFNDKTEEPVAIADAIVEADDALLACLSTTPMRVDDLPAELDLSMASLQPLLLELELEGKIQRHPGNKVSLSGVKKAG